MLILLYGQNSFYIKFFIHIMCKLTVDIISLLHAINDSKEKKKDSVKTDLSLLKHSCINRVQIYVIDAY